MKLEGKNLVKKIKSGSGNTREKLALSVDRGGDLTVLKSKTKTQK